LLEERRLTTIARSRGIPPKEGESIGRLLGAWLRKAEGSELGRRHSALCGSGVDAGKASDPQP